MKRLLAGTFLLKNTKAYIMLFFVVVISLVFGLLTNGVFLIPRNIALLARQTTVVGILSIGMMFVIVAGHIDLSVGSMLGFCGTLAAVLQVWLKVDTYSTILIVMLVGMLLGVWQGFWIAYMKVPAFIITLGGLLIFKGMKLGLSKSTSIAPMNVNFAYLGQGFLTDLVGWVLAIVFIVFFSILVISKRRSKKNFNIATPDLRLDILKIITVGVLLVIAVLVTNSYKGMPVPVLILMCLALIFHFIAKKTVYGRSVYAIGGNIEAARLSGIKTRTITMVIFILSGLLSALAGIILTARLNAATAAAGDGMELDAIAACVIGGTSMSGGIGIVPGVLVGGHW
jgi:D-xylose transport system permease protein